MMSTSSLHQQLIDRVRSMSLTPTPWPHAYLAETLPTDLALRLSRSFDLFVMKSEKKNEQTKSYRLATVRLDEDGMPLNVDWRSVVDVLSSSAYRECLAELAGLSLAESTLTLSLWEYHSGDWLAPHVDKPEKIITQIFYLTEGWTEGDGGRLLILNAPDVSAVARSLPPRLGSSTVLPRSGKSWHAVEPPTITSPVRRSVTATFWR